MNVGEPVSMVETEHEAQIVLLILLAAVLLILVKNGGNVSGYRFAANYNNNYLCATDEYNYHDGQFDIEFGLKDDGTYRMGVVDSQYSIGSFKEVNQTYAVSEDGANEVNYYLSLKREKTYAGSKDTTEELGKEEMYILNVNEKSDVVVLMEDDGDGAVYYCKVKN